MFDLELFKSEWKRAQYRPDDAEFFIMRWMPQLMQVLDEMEPKWEDGLYYQGGIDCGDLHTTKDYVGSCDGEISLCQSGTDAPLFATLETDEEEIVLSRSEAEVLWPFIRRFAKTGRIVPDCKPGCSCDDVERTVVESVAGLPETLAGAEAGVQGQDVPGTDNMPAHQVDTGLESCIFPADHDYGNP